MALWAASLAVPVAEAAAPEPTEALDGWGRFRFGMPADDVRRAAAEAGQVESVLLENTEVVRLAAEALDPQILAPLLGPTDMIGLLRERADSRRVPPRPNAVVLTFQHRGRAIRAEFGFLRLRAEGEGGPLEGGLSTVALFSTNREPDPARCVGHHDGTAAAYAKEHPDASAAEGGEDTTWRRKTSFRFARGAQADVITRYEPDNPELVGLAGRCHSQMVLYGPGRRDPGEPSQGLDGWGPYRFGMGVRAVYASATRGGKAAEVKQTRPGTGDPGIYLETDESFGGMPVRLSVDFPRSDGAVLSFFLLPKDRPSEGAGCLALYAPLVRRVAQDYPGALFEGEQASASGKDHRAQEAQFRLWGGAYIYVFVGFDPPSSHASGRNPPAGRMPCTALVQLIRKEDRKSVDELRARAIAGQLRNRGTPPAQ